MVHTIGESRPRVRDGRRLWRRHFAELEIDKAIVGEICAVQAHAVGTVGLVSQPEKTICAHTEEFCAIIIAMLDPQAEAGRSAANSATRDRKSTRLNSSHR